MKFRRLTTIDAECALLGAGMDSIVAVRLEAGDVGDDAAAEQASLAVRGIDNTVEY